MMLHDRDTNKSNAIDRIRDVETAVLRLRDDVQKLRDTIGTEPSIDGRPGTGMAGMLHRIANHVIYGSSRGAIESLSTDGRHVANDDWLDKIRASELAQKKAEIELQLIEKQAQSLAQERHAKRKLITSIIVSALGSGLLLGLIQLLTSCAW